MVSSCRWGCGRRCPPYPRKRAQGKPKGGARELVARRRVAIGLRGVLRTKGKTRRNRESLHHHDLTTHLDLLLLPSNPQICCARLVQPREIPRYVCSSIHPLPPPLARLLTPLPPHHTPPTIPPTGRIGREARSQRPSPRLLADGQDAAWALFGVSASGSLPFIFLGGTAGGWAHFVMVCLSKGKRNSYATGFWHQKQQNGDYSRFWPLPLPVGCAIPLFFVSLHVWSRGLYVCV